MLQKLRGDELSHPMRPTDRESFRVGVLGSLGCHSKTPQTRGSSAIALHFLTVLEAEQSKATGPGWFGSGESSLALP